MGSENNEELKAVVEKVKKHLKVTKVVCTRSVKGRGGDSYVGFSAAWDTTQDDAGGGADQISAHTDADEKMAASQGLSLKESRIASLILGMQADIAAHDHAMAGGNLSMGQRDEAVKAIKHNYSRLMVDAMNGNGNGNGKQA